MKLPSNGGFNPLKKIKKVKHLITCDLWLFRLEKGIQIHSGWAKNQISAGSQNKA